VKGALHWAVCEAGAFKAPASFLLAIFSFMAITNNLPTRQDHRWGYPALSVA
jgi:hypothetical protein